MNPWTILASGFGAGYAPKAPGTFGSLVGLALGCLLLHLGHLPLLFGIVIVTALGIYAVGRLSPRHERGVAQFQSLVRVAHTATEPGT